MTSQTARIQNRSGFFPPFKKKKKTLVMMSNEMLLYPELKTNDITTLQFPLLLLISQEFLISFMFYPM